MVNDLDSLASLLAQLTTDQRYIVSGTNGLRGGSATEPSMQSAFNMHSQSTQPVFMSDRGADPRDMMEPQQGQSRSETGTGIRRCPAGSCSQGGWQPQVANLLKLTQTGDPDAHVAEASTAAPTIQMLLRFAAFRGATSASLAMSMHARLVQGAGQLEHQLASSACSALQLVFKHLSEPQQWAAITASTCLVAAQGSHDATHEPEHGNILAAGCDCLVGTCSQGGWLPQLHKLQQLTQVGMQAARQAHASPAVSTPEVKLRSAIIGCIGHVSSAFFLHTLLMEEAGCTAHEEATEAHKALQNVFHHLPENEQWAAIGASTCLVAAQGSHAAVMSQWKHDEVANSRSRKRVVDPDHNSYLLRDADVVAGGVPTTMPTQQTAVRQFALKKFMRPDLKP